MADENRPPIVVKPVQGPFGPNFSGGDPFNSTPFGQFLAGNNPNISLVNPAQTPANAAQQSVNGPIFSQQAAANAAGSGSALLALNAIAPPTVGNQQIPKPSPTPVNTTPPPMPTSFAGQIPFFLESVLSTPAGALPKGPLWVVVFDFDNYIKNTIKSVSLYEPQMPEKWQIEKALDTITSKRYQEEKGCILAQSVSIPGESIITNAEGTQYNGFIRSQVGQGRQDFSALRMSFLNTNVSFVDNVIRPWTVMTGHLGLIARPRSEKYRCNITVYKLGVNTVDTPPFVAQKFNFYGACPTEVEEETYNYEAAMTIVKSATFVYQWYTTSSAENLFAQS